MDKKQFEIFNSAFYKAMHERIVLPENIDVHKIYVIEVYPDGMRDGYKVRFKINLDQDKNHSIELLGSNDHYSWHKCIDDEGNITDLENYKGQFGRNIYPDDAERTAKEHKEIQEYNNELQQVLIKKGLERNFANDEFEKNNVIVIRNYTPLSHD